MLQSIKCHIFQVLLHKSLRKYFENHQYCCACYNENEMLPKKIPLDSSDNTERRYLKNSLFPLILIITFFLKSSMTFKASSVSSLNNYLPFFQKITNPNKGITLKNGLEGF